MKNFFLWGMVSIISLVLMGPFSPTQAAPVGTGFTYQGRLTDNGQPAEGAYDFQFRLYDAATGGAQIGVTVTREDIPVTKGLFTISDLDFGSGIFNGEARWIDISVRPGDSPGFFTPLGPLQAVTAAPYAIYALASPGGSTGSWVDYGSIVSLATNTDRVGIGTSTPSAELHVKGSSWVQGVFESTDSSGGIQLVAKDPAAGVSGGKYEFQALMDGGFILYDRIDGRYVMNVDTNGNVGFGTNTPAGRLQGETSSNVIGHSIYGIYGKASGIMGSNYGVFGESSSLLGGSNYGVYGKSSGGMISGTGYAVYGENTTGGYGGYFIGDGYFSGNVGIGTTIPGVKLNVDGQIRARNGYGDYISLGGDDAGGDLEVTIYAPASRNGITFWNAQLATPANIGAATVSASTLHLTSDLRLKKNIMPIDGALDKVASLRGVTFEWRREESFSKGFDEGKKMGLIAQEVEGVLPEVVSRNVQNGNKSVEYANLVAVLIEAVKELRVQNKRLQSRIEVLEGQGSLRDGR